MMARCSVSVFLLVALMCASQAAAAPCIECKDCQGMQSCLQVCKQTCTTAPAINPADCLSYGRQAASSVSQKACTMAMDYCGGPSPQVTTSAMAKSTSASLSLVQCANSAFSTCQSTAMDPAASPCGKYIGGGPGYKQCNGKQFDTFYAGIVNDACRASADMIQNGVVLPVPATPIAVQSGYMTSAWQATSGNRKLLQGQVIIKNPTTVGPHGATASSIQSIPVPAGAQVIVPGQPTVLPANPQVIVAPSSVPQQVLVPGQVQPVLLQGQVQPAGVQQVVYPGQPVVVPGQVIYTTGH